MAKLVKGDKFPCAKVNTLKNEEVCVSSLAGKSGKTAYVFLRYYGCSLSQFDVATYAKCYADIKAKGNELVVALQSTAESISRQCPIQIPFNVICDPEAKLYKQLDIQPAEDMQQAGGEVTSEKIQRLRATTDIKHGDYEGIEEQLPAYFVVDADMNVLVAHYSAEMGDVPTPEDFEKLFA